MQGAGAGGDGSLCAKLCTDSGFCTKGGGGKKRTPGCGSDRRSFGWAGRGDGREVFAVRSQFCVSGFVLCGLGLWGEVLGGGALCKTVHDFGILHRGRGCREEAE